MLFFNKRKKHSLSTEAQNMLEQYEQESREYEQWKRIAEPIESKYFRIMQEIQDDWSALYNLKQFSGPIADKFEQKCLDNIQNYFNLVDVESQKLGSYSLPNVPAIYRLCMLYEKQSRYDDCIKLCMLSLDNGIDGAYMKCKGRMARMIKKSKREPTALEMKYLT